MNRAVFLDRDDTLIANVPYLGDPAQARIFSDAPAALQRLRAAGFLLIVVSNQSGVGRGLISKEQVKGVNQEMERQLGAPLIHAYYLCFAAPEDPYGGQERKPSPILVQRAAADYDIDLTKSFFIGDRSVDVLCGKRAGCRSVLVLTGPADDDQKKAAALADERAESLTQAVDWILCQP